MIFVKFVITIFFGLLIGFVIVVLYVKLLSVVDKYYGNSIRAFFHLNQTNSNSLLHDVSKTRSNGRQDSYIEICCIYCFDKTNDFLNTNIFRRISGVIKYFVRKLPISDNSHAKDKSCNPKYCDAEFKSPFHLKRIIKRLATKCKQNQNK